MKVTAWNRSDYRSDGNGYGIKVCATDRDRYFDRSWKTVKIKFCDTGVEVDVKTNKPSFWNKKCRELIKKEIGEFIIRHGSATWQKDAPPVFDLIPDGVARFILCSRHNSFNSFWLWLCSQGRVIDELDGKGKFSILAGGFSGQTADSATVNSPIKFSIFDADAVWNRFHSLPNFRKTKPQNYQAPAWNVAPNAIISTRLAASIQKFLDNSY